MRNIYWNKTTATEIFIKNKGEKTMKNSFKKLLSVILCLSLLMTTFSFGSQAVYSSDAVTRPSVKVYTKLGQKTKLDPGETTEVTIEYYPEYGVPFEIEYYASDPCCDVEFIQDEYPLLFTAKVTAVSPGKCTIGFRIVDLEGKTRAFDYIDIIVKDNPTEGMTFGEKLDYYKEKVQTYFESIPDILEMYNYMFNLIAYLMAMSLASDLAIIRNWFAGLFN